MSKPVSGGGAFVLALAGILLFIVLPWLVAESLGVREVILPSLKSVFKTAYELVFSNELAKATLVSLARVNLGFVLAVATAVPLGIFLGRHKVLFRAAEPLIESFRFVVAFAWIPLAILCRFKCRKPV